MLRTMAILIALLNVTLAAATAVLGAAPEGTVARRLRRLWVAVHVHGVGTMLGSRSAAARATSAAWRET
jgi:hypothetical protein